MNTYETQFKLDSFFSTALMVVAVAWIALGSMQAPSAPAPAGVAPASLAAAPERLPAASALPRPANSASARSMATRSAS